MRAWTGRRDQRLRSALRTAALGYAERGWEVVPGAFLLVGDRRLGGATGRRCSCLRSACPTPGAHPVDPDWLRHATNATHVVEWWWSHRPHSVVLPVGTAFDVLDAPAAAGPLALSLLRARATPVGPVARRSPDRWQFLVSLSGRSFAELEARCGVRHQAAGAFLVAPPTRLGRCDAVQWVCPPTAANRRLAPAAAVAEVLEQACATLPAPVWAMPPARVPVRSGTHPLSAAPSPV